ncbi:MAG: hypothetical protein QXR85_02080 [Candidatus Micrarchaeaceae archaeon]
MEEKGGLVGFPEFAKKISGSDGRQYLVDDAEKKDLAYLIENTCMYCGRLMAKGEVKILPPSYIIERDAYVRNGVVRRRLMCVSCYNKIRSAAKDKITYAQENKQNTSSMVRETIRRFLLSRQ